MTTEPTTRVTKITDFLTEEEIAKAMMLYDACPIGSFARSCEELLIAPNLERIEKALGQKMHPRYVAYMVEYVLMQAKGKMR